MISNATLINVLSAEGQGGGDAAETLGRHMQSMVPKQIDNEGNITEVEPTEASMVPPFIAKMLCFALPLLRKLVKVDGKTSDAIDILIAFVCAQN